jgi:hypothetical protein
MQDRYRPRRLGDIVRVKIGEYCLSMPAGLLIKRVEETRERVGEVRKNVEEDGCLDEERWKKVEEGKKGVEEVRKNVEQAQSLKQGRVGTVEWLEQQNRWVEEQDRWIMEEERKREESEERKREKNERKGEKIYRRIERRTQLAILLAVLNFSASFRQFLSQNFRSLCTCSNYLLQPSDELTIILSDRRSAI